MNVSPPWPRQLPASTSALLYGLVEAALSDVECDRTNVHKVQVSLDVSGSRLVASISDDGRYLGQPRAARNRSTALRTVRDFAFQLGGHLVIESRRGPGTTTKVIFPAQAGGARQGAPVRPARVVVADDQTVLLTGVVRLLRDDPRVEVVGHAADGEETLRLAELLRPDVVLLKLEGPGAGVVDLVARVKAATPQVNVIVLDGSDASACLEALAAGASGYIPENPEPEALVSNIVSVLGGLCLFPRSLEPFAVARAPRQPYSQRLTGRELEVLSLAATGLSNKEIGWRLGASYKTVRNHVSSIYTKLQIHDRSQAVLYAVRAGLV